SSRRMKRSTSLAVPIVSCVLALCGAVAVPSVAAQPSAAGERTIARVSGDLYRLQDGRRATVFLVTDAGILLADPLDDAAARWLKAALAERFPGRIVRYVVQSYPTFDRASGGLVFRPEADVVGHASFNNAVAAESRVWPPSVAALDRNGNKRLDADELAA